jgi:hypothetical protein
MTLNGTNALLFGELTQLKLGHHQTPGLVSRREVRHLGAWDGAMRVRTG